MCCICCGKGESLSASNLSVGTKNMKSKHGRGSEKHMREAISYYQKQSKLDGHSQKVVLYVLGYRAFPSLFQAPATPSLCSRFVYGFRHQPLPHVGCSKAISNPPLSPLVFDHDLDRPLLETPSPRQTP
jgi:hypothetical protein